MPENTNLRSGAGIWTITCNSLVSCAPSCTFGPSRTFAPSLGSSPDRALCTCSPADVVETREFPAAPAVVLSWGEPGDGDGFGQWARGQTACPCSPAPSAVSQGKAATLAEEIYTCLTILSPAPPGMGLECLSLVPRSPLGWVLSCLSSCFLAAAE